MSYGSDDSDDDSDDEYRINPLLQSTISVSAGSVPRSAIASSGSRKSVHQAKSPPKSKTKAPLKSVLKPALKKTELKSVLKSSLATKSSATGSLHRSLAAKVGSSQSQLERKAASQATRLARLAALRAVSTKHPPLPATSNSATLARTRPHSSVSKNLPFWQLAESQSQSVLPVKATPVRQVRPTRASLSQPYTVKQATKKSSDLLRSLGI